MVRDSKKMSHITKYQNNFWKNLASNRDATAIVCADNSITYAQIEKIILDLNKQFDKNEHLAYCASRSIESAVFTLFCLMTGRSFSPISEKVLKSAVQNYLYQASAKSLIEPKKIIKIKNISQQPDVEYYNYREEIQFAQKPTDTQYILFTSGSTGTPKGVPISFSNLETYYDAAHNILKPTGSDIFSQTFDHSFDLAIHDILLAMSSFSKLVVLNEDELRRPARSISKYKISIWFSVPSLIPFFKGPSENYGFHSLRLVMFCGEKFFTEHAQYLYSLGVKNIQNWYGPTEATIACSYYQFTSYETSETLPIGTPFRGSKFEYYEDQDGQQLLIGGDQLFKNYTNNVSGDFITISGDRYYESGDLINKIGNEIYVIGRNNAMVKINGFRVDLNEIENAASKVLPNSNVVALAMYQGSSICLIIENNIDMSNDSLIEKIALMLPKYSRPNKIYTVSKFPRSIAGKIDRKALGKQIDDNIKSDYGKSDIISNVNKSVKVSNLGLDSLQLMRLFLEIEGIMGKDLSFINIEQFLGMTLQEILSNDNINRSVAAPKNRYIKTKDVYFNSRCRRYSVIYHRHQNLVTSKTKYMAIGSSGLYRALGSFRGTDSDMVNFCTPGMSLEAIKVLCKRISLIDRKDIKVIFEIDPVMLTDERPKGDFLVYQNSVPRPPFLSFGSNEYDYQRTKNGFALIQQKNKRQKMLWQKKREKIIEECYSNTKIWNNNQVSHIRKAYSYLNKSFETVLVYIQPLRSIQKIDLLQEEISKILENVKGEQEISFLDLDDVKYEESDFQDLNHFSSIGAEKLKKSLKK